jgi:type IV pilus assembly protein PilQ
MKSIKIFLLFSVSFLFFTSSVCFSLDVDTSSYFILPEYSKKISMDFQNASLITVLKIFSQQTNLNLIASDEIANKTVTVYLDNVPVEQALEQILRANNLTYEIQPGSNIYIVRTIQRPNIELTTRVYHLKYASVQSAKINTLIQVTAEDGGRSSNTAGGIIPVIQAILTSQGKITEDPRTNSLIITDIVTNFPIIDQTIARLDISVPQVLIEVEMLEVAKSNADKIGIKWGDTPLAFTGGQKYGVFPFDGSVPFFEKPAFGIDYEDARFVTSVMDATGLTATLQFLKTQNDTKNLARPRILTLNNQAAEIKIATDEAIGVKRTSNDADITVEAERVETGVTLVVTPQANLETGIITMAIQPKVIIAKTGATFTEATFKDAEERSAKTILKVATGDTIVIGGLVREETTTLFTKVPFLGDLPIIGKAFRHTDISKNERELIIFITPHILPDPEKSATATTARTQRLLREQEAPASK